MEDVRSATMTVLCTAIDGYCSRLFEIEHTFGFEWQTILLLHHLSLSSLSRYIVYLPKKRNHIHRRSVSIVDGCTSA